LSAIDAGLVRLVLWALRAILAPSLALVRFIDILAFMLGAAKHWEILATILPLRLPPVHLYFLTSFLPLLPHICFSLRSEDMISVTSITVFMF